MTCLVPRKYIFLARQYHGIIEEQSHGRQEHSNNINNKDMNLAWIKILNELPPNVSHIQDHVIF